MVHMELPDKVEKFSFRTQMVHLHTRIQHVMLDLRYVGTLCLALYTAPVAPSPRTSNVDQT